MEDSTELNLKMIRRLLVWAPNWVGDAVMAAPAIDAIARRIPDARISLLVRRPVSDLFMRHLRIDRILLYDPTGRHGGLGSFRLVLDVRKERFDAALLLPNSFRAAAISAAAGIPNRWGYGTDGRSLLLTRPVPPPLRRPHQVVYYKNLVDVLVPERGPSAEVPPAPSLLLGEDEAAEGLALLTKKGVRLPVIGMHLGAAYGSAKRWSPKRFGEAARRLSSAGFSIVFFGGPEDRPLAEEAAASAGSGISTIFAGEIDLRGAMAVIHHCAVFLSNDSGPMHVAAALRRPVVAIFGPTNPQITSPVGDTTVIIRRPVPCSPCMFRDCPIDHPCMEQITVEEVVGAVLRSAGLPQHMIARRSLTARPRGRRAVFVDRDGTINREVGHVDSPEKIDLLPGASEAIAALRGAGFLVIMTTNQSGVARGLFSEEILSAVNARVAGLLAEQGAALDAIYYCPHLPDALCGCRKPAPGMLDRAVGDLGVDLSRSFVVGDKVVDLKLALNAGAQGILVKTGYGRRAVAEREREVAAANPRFIAEDLLAAARFILRQKEEGR